MIQNQPLSVVNYGVVSDSRGGLLIIRRSKINAVIMAYGGGSSSSMRALEAAAALALRTQRSGFKIERLR